MSAMPDEFPENFREFVLEERAGCSHIWYNLPGNYTRKCENCEREENLW